MPPASASTPYSISACSDFDFEKVKEYIGEFELDDRALAPEQFLTASGSSGLVGFGRIRHYAGFSEMCSLGILPAERTKGLARRLVDQLLEKAGQTVYLVCIIPSFFEAHQFTICTDYPPEIREKLAYCLQSLSVPEPYVVMKHG